MASLLLSPSNGIGDHLSLSFPGSTTEFSGHRPSDVSILNSSKTQENAISSPCWSRSQLGKLPGESGSKRTFDQTVALDKLLIRPTKKPRLASAGRKSLELVCGSCYLPKPNGKYPKGQDAHFMCPIQSVIGVADGLGGFNKRGIDSGVYARNLMFHAAKATAEEPRGGACPLRILKKAVSMTRAEGGSTACIVAIQGHKILAANVGDSGFLVIRNGEVAYRSPTQVRRFNSPLYLHADSCNHAQVLQVPVEAGDVIVAATDGLFDNIFEEAMRDVINKGKKDGFGPEEIAANLAGIAQKKSLNEKLESPYSKASREAGFHHVGGKEDDITIIIANVC
ncbi:probable protein phosphatase 2C 55 [Aristolochia californica]|uniref:probable protein phosphatase 2C 55 n=1 Tax=Aristolochia californica TaxID=171875 RepID=UPI0035E07A06